ncbi:hypothetical protein STIAU_7311 [Stigmatella aurantiaca DW4/3-1]|uniref:Uncharacterized protein n=1 Tax=Stigmatella aurantiaca (strain DW4/3-1) TaxID=378806 RepID=Q08S99_STIAD|nr:hypothetical protein STIAU_7311 [Stigmatella aurantiaca DW4/3-1]
MPRPFEGQADILDEGLVGARLLGVEQHEIERVLRAAEHGQGGRPLHPDPSEQPIGLGVLAGQVGRVRIAVVGEDVPGPMKPGVHEEAAHVAARIQHPGPLGQPGQKAAQLPLVIVVTGVLAVGEVHGEPRAQLQQAAPAGRGAIEDVGPLGGEPQLLSPGRVVAQQHRAGSGHLHDGARDFLQARVHGPGQRLDDEVCVVAVHDEAGQSVPIVIHQPAETRVIQQAGPALQGVADMAGDEPLRALLGQPQAAHGVGGLQVHVSQAQHGSILVPELGGLAGRGRAIHGQDVLSTEPEGAVTQLLRCFPGQIGVEQSRPPFAAPLRSTGLCARLGEHGGARGCWRQAPRRHAGGQGRERQRGGGRRKALRVTRMSTAPTIRAIASTGSKPAPRHSSTRATAESSTPRLTVKAWERAQGLGAELRARTRTGRLSALRHREPPSSSTSSCGSTSPCT